MNLGQPELALRDGRLQMPKNASDMDRFLRVGFGLALLSLTVIGSTWWGLVGLLPLVTGLVGYCPAYRLLGLSTCGQAPRAR